LTRYKKETGLPGIGKPVSFLGTLSGIKPFRLGAQWALPIQIYPQLGHAGFVQGFALA